MLFGGFIELCPALRRVSLVKGGRRTPGEAARAIVRTGYRLLSFLDLICVD